MSFDDIINQHGKSIYRYCFHMLRHKQEAEDAAQEIFIKAYRSYDNLKDKDALDAWLYKSAYRHCLNIIRRKKLLSFVSISDNELLQTREEMQYEISVDADITSILNKLSPSDRTLIYLKVLEDKSHAEIAEIMDMSNTAVRKQYERAKNRVRKLYINDKEGNVNEEVSFL